MSRIDLCLLQRQSISKETQNHQTFSSLLGTLQLYAGDVRETLYETCAYVIIIPLYETLHNRPFSVTCEESLRDSEPPDIFLQGTQAPREGRLHEV